MLYIFVIFLILNWTFWQHFLLYFCNNFLIISHSIQFTFLIILLNLFNGRCLFRYLFRCSISRCRQKRVWEIFGIIIRRLIILFFYRWYFMIKFIWFFVNFLRRFKKMWFYRLWFGSIYFYLILNWILKFGR